MCGRYTLFTEEQTEDIRNIIREVQEKQPENNMKSGEIFPTNTAPILKAEGSQLGAGLAIWGFPKFDGKGVIINARSETAEQKKMFRESLLTRRCVIPSTGFYEWSQDERKQKYLFRLPDTTALYMAGFYNEFKGERRYVILTADANSSISDVHNRMPVVLDRNSLIDWVFDTEKALNYLHQGLPLLVKREVYTTEE